MPVARPVKVTLVPVPSTTASPGVLITDQFPVAGNPVRLTLPVPSSQVGCVMVPIVGASGLSGGAFTVAPADAGDVHPPAVKVKV